MHKSHLNCIIVQNSVHNGVFLSEGHFRVKEDTTINYILKYKIVKAQKSLCCL